MEDSSRVGAPQACFIPWIQLDNYQVIPNTPEINLKTGKTNFTTNSRGETTSKKVENAEMQLRRETNHGWDSVE